MSSGLAKRITMDSPKASDPQRIVDDYYEHHYQHVHGGGRLGAAAAIMHTKLERGRQSADFPITLELGSGAFQHYKFVQHRHDLYIASDIRVPGQGEDPETRTCSGDSPTVAFVQADAVDLPFHDHSVDRIVTSCLILHIPDPHAAIVEWQRVCRPDGYIDFLVQCDPGMAVRAFRRVFSERTARRHGVSAERYRLVNAIDHINGFPRVQALAAAALEDGRRLSVHFYPFSRLPSWNLNVFAIFSIGPRT